MTGAVASSSPYLARAMAKQAAGASAIIELGAGTGAVTKALLTLCDGTPIKSVELNARLAEQLRRRFPRLEVLTQSASSALDAHPSAKGCVVVSSLPFRSLPLRVREASVHSIRHFLERSDGSWLVQYTYHARAPFKAFPGFVWSRQAVVLANLPPATVWSLRRAECCR